MKIPLQRILKITKIPSNRILEITKKNTPRNCFSKISFSRLSLDDEFPWLLAASSAQNESDRHRYGDGDLISSVLTRKDGYRDGLACVRRVGMD